MQANTVLGMCTTVYLSFGLSDKSVCVRSKAWLATSVRLRLARPRDTLAATPGLLAQALVTETVNQVQWVQTLGTQWYESGVRQTYHTQCREQWTTV